MIKKGQVSTEYLVILAVVLVIALIMVYLIGGFTGLGSMETQSKNYWAYAAPFSISSFEASGTSLELEVQNNDFDSLTITGISIDGDIVYSEELSFASGEAKNLTATLPSACGDAGITFNYGKVVITYDKGALTGLQQTGSRPFVGKCS